MEILNGQGACPGIAAGRLLYLKHHYTPPVRSEVDSVSQELRRLDSACRKAAEELEQLRQMALERVGESEASLFEIQQMMLEDPDYIESVEGLIFNGRANAEWAVQQTASHFAKVFAKMDDPYMRERADDIKDVSRRLVRLLQGREEPQVQITDSVILAVDDLSPSEMIRLDDGKVLGLAIAGGAATSHASILARTMEIPTVVGLGAALSNRCNKQFAIVDGGTGRLYLQPDEDTRLQMEEECRRQLQQHALLQKLRGLPNETQDGQRVLVFANIGSIRDVEAALQHDADGIGLVRSEFLYLEQHDYPTEEHQFEVYKEIAQRMDGRRVIIRTLDIGADKQAEYFALGHEDNPALGMRAIRISLTRPEVFRTQMRALYRASVFGKIAIMFPMVTSVWEVRKCREMALQVQRELVAEGIPFEETVELGIMIETPAAAIISDQLAKEVDFFSIGTNDLTQYILAVDRQNPALVPFADPHHPALLRAIHTVVDNAHKAGIRVALCGDLAADPAMTDTFLALGIDELSVAPSGILPLRQRIRATNVSAVRNEILYRL